MCGLDDLSYKRLIRANKPPPEEQYRTIHITTDSAPTHVKYPPNVIINKKYNIFTFLPKVLYNQFSLFMNFFFLAVAMIQLYPPLRINSLYTFWTPLSFVIAVNLIREGIDDFRRFLRDKEANSQKYDVIDPTGVYTRVPSSQLAVGDIVKLLRGQRVPADMVLLRTMESTGRIRIRTDQLDGETDWKVRVAVDITQKLQSDEGIKMHNWTLVAPEPVRDINRFHGNFSKVGGNRTFPLNLENTLWTNTVVVSESATCVVMYTGRDTKAALNISKPSSKIGKVDLEVNKMIKVLFIVMVALASVVMILKTYVTKQTQPASWVIDWFRFLMLFSSIIPLSLRVNLDVIKILYSFIIHKDKEIPGTVARSTTIPEQLGRIDYLLSDKTGTLTQNSMILRKVATETDLYTNDNFNDIPYMLREYSGMRALMDSMLAISLCHDVTPVDSTDAVGLSSRVYNAASPDEVALVSWAEEHEFYIIERSPHSIRMRIPGQKETFFDILELFPFTSFRKRMGIVLQNRNDNSIVFYLKGADSIMNNIVNSSDSTREQISDFAREGLRTLIYGQKVLSKEQYDEFKARYEIARASMVNRDFKCEEVVEILERNMDLVCITGVEDQLQEGVPQTLEIMSNAGIRVWMLTGDKEETAVSVAKSSRLISKSQSIYPFPEIYVFHDIRPTLNEFRRRTSAVLVISGDSLEKFTSLTTPEYSNEFFELACLAPSVVVFRCSPSQKASIANKLKIYSRKQICAIGDGGNDVSMIQEADVGIGIFGKEGMQAALAADYSLPQFSYISRLLLVHGRYSYLRSSLIAQFVIHRSIILTTLQAIFCSVLYFISFSLFPGILLILFSIFFAQLPILSLLFDKDVNPEIALQYPELYRQMQKGRLLNLKSLFWWVLIGVYQGSTIMIISFSLFSGEFSHIVAITFTSLLLTELIMIPMIAYRIIWWMLIPCSVSMISYIVSVYIIPDVFDLHFMGTPSFLWKVTLLTLVACIPLAIVKYLRRKISPPSYSKLNM